MEIYLLKVKMVKNFGKNLITNHVISKVERELRVKTKRDIEVLN